MSVEVIKTWKREIKIGGYNQGYKAQKNTSVGCLAGLDNPEVYASLLAEHHRMYILVGLL